MKQFFLLFFFGCFITCKTPKKSEYINLQGNVFGTTYLINYNASKNYQAQIDSLFTAINKSLSTYIPTSDISKINEGDSTVIIDKYFIEVMQKSKQIFAETKGYFDPTVGNLVNAWGFGSKKRINNLDNKQVQEMMQFVGFDKVSVKNNRIKKQFPEIYLDFNSIAKGYGIDVIARFLESKSINNYLIDIGGEIKASGVSSKQKLWKVGLDNPNTDGTRTVEKVIELNNKSMAGSGNYRHYRIAKNGKKYVHTINPKTGFAIESNLLAAYVIAPIDCANVDAYATAFMAMGLEKTKEFLINNYPKIKVILLYTGKNGEIAEFAN